jgi:phospholipase C
MALHLDMVDTVFITMMENRSFDQMLGYLSLPPFNRNIDGLTPDLLANFVNRDSAGRVHRPFHNNNPMLPSRDPNHSRGAMALQLGARTADGFALDGFVRNWENAWGLQPPDDSPSPAVLGYFDQVDVPAMHFFAEQFAVCDRWFASLPTSTGPNRFMSLAGYVVEDDTNAIAPTQTLVYDWLAGHNVRWRVYYTSMPFVAKMLGHFDFLIHPNFRHISALEADLANESAIGTFPQVVFLEPGYRDLPAVIRDVTDRTINDDHPPCSIHLGQQFLANTYRLLSGSRLWSRLVWLIMYDENGGMFDHCSPPLLETPVHASPPPAPFESLGFRVPAMVVSPLVAPGSVFSDLLDHTSVLKFLGDRYGAHGYSPDVDPRKVTSIADLPFLEKPRLDVPVMPSI